MAITDEDRKRTDESYNRLQKKRALNKVFILTSFVLITTGMVVLITSVFNYNNDKKAVTYFKSSKDIKDFQLSFDSLSKSQDSLQKKLLAQFEILKADSGKSNGNNNGINRKLFFIEQRIKQDSIQIYNLRASINPDKPDEVLRLARLNDKIEQLKQDNINLKENLKSEEAKFETAVNNQLSNSRTFYIALITILAPITFKFIMQLFKDFNKSTD